MTAFVASRPFFVEGYPGAAPSYQSEYLSNGSVLKDLTNSGLMLSHFCKKRSAAF